MKTGFSQGDLVKLRPWFARKNPGHEDQTYTVKGNWHQGNGMYWELSDAPWSAPTSALLLVKASTLKCECADVIVFGHGNPCPEHPANVTRKARKS